VFSKLLFALFDLTLPLLPPPPTTFLNSSPLLAFRPFLLLGSTSRSASLGFRHTRYLSILGLPKCRCFFVLSHFGSVYFRLEFPPLHRAFRDGHPPPLEYSPNPPPTFRPPFHSINPLFCDVPLSAKDSEFLLHQSFFLPQKIDSFSFYDRTCLLGHSSQAFLFFSGPPPSFPL